MLNIFQQQTPDQMRAGYASNAAGLRSLLARAEHTGKPANGYTADDLRTKVALFERLSMATDADVIAHVDQNAARMRDRLAELRRG